MAQMRERIFAGFGALLFLGSACALTVFVLLQPSSSSDVASNAQKAAQSASQKCTDNKTEPTLPVPDIYKASGKVTALQKTDLTVGTGPAAKNGDCLVVKYYGTLASNGTKFDEDFTDTTALAFVLGSGQVITGWDQGVVGMKAGGVRRLVIPAAQAYGSQAVGSIPANSDLVFVVKLLRIQKL
jgi:FKBP-type peptidyl-prolyl cis-trans isomerase